MELPQKAVDEFKKIFEKKYGVELPDELAREYTEDLMALYRAVYVEPLAVERDLTRPSQSSKQVDFKDHPLLSKEREQI